MANYLTWLKKNNIFNNSMSKMSSNISLNHEELEFMLTCSIIFLNEYNKDNRKSNYFEVAYYITLKCANNNKCYEPLLDVSSNYGLYPVSKYILSNLIENGNSINDFFLDYQLDKYRYQNIIETYEQKNHRAQLVSSKNKENCYVAPTSFGKSSLIIEIIKEQSANKIAIIVPTKSLLQQTFKLIKSKFSNKNIIYHDEMYNGERNFIAIFTQERALRLLKNKELSFDLLIIDEAHNIFEMDSRSLLLTRLIRRNRHRNSSSINYYLSPLISDADNLKMSAKQKIFERRIINNIKEPDITEYRKCGSVYRY
ncbi:DEAD/DEAH box helicase family protein, partial [Photobacterium leiognathi]|uniref:DEAD/DEAH box helicase family protein n=1 Tax=Photobacterium leiognathi TaxID=553611 RepID=UPI0005BA65E6